MHWSLCVVINPGKIQNNALKCQHNTNTTYVLFFNSLDSHTAHRYDILSNVKRWLSDVYKDKNPHKFIKNIMYYI